jgi:hypothetical protein
VLVLVHIELEEPFSIRPGPLALSVAWGRTTFRSLAGATLSALGLRLGVSAQPFTDFTDVPAINDSVL